MGWDKEKDISITTVAVRVYLARPDLPDRARSLTGMRHNDVAQGALDILVEYLSGGREEDYGEAANRLFRKGGRSEEIAAWVLLGRPGEHRANQ